MYLRYRNNVYNLDRTSKIELQLPEFGAQNGGGIVLYTGITATDYIFFDQNTTQDNIHDVYEFFKTHLDIIEYVPVEE